jgi:hypothetical protein
MPKNIAILSTVVNFDLYRKSAPLFPKGIPKYVIDGRNGMHGIDSIRYMFRKLKNEGIDWLIMADEDVLFINPNLVFGLIERMENEGTTVCGVRDGGLIPHRMQNPHAINTFFSVLNFKQVLSIWNEKEMLANQYTLAGEFEDDLSQLHSEYNVESAFEPYYCFYFWLRRKGKKILFLDAKMPFADDQIANLVKDDLGNDLLYHTWYARSYGANEKHTKRIDAIFDKVRSRTTEPVQPVVFKDATYAFKKKLKKQYLRIVNKIKSFTI